MTTRGFIRFSTKQVCAKYRRRSYEDLSESCRIHALGSVLHNALEVAQAHVDVGLIVSDPLGALVGVEVTLDVPGKIRIAGFPTLLEVFLLLLYLQPRELMGPLVRSPLTCQITPNQHS